MPKAEDPLLSGKVVTNSVGLPTTLWKAVDEEVVLLSKKSRSALLTEIVYEAIVALRAQREKPKK
jgi:hypothetical protein